jgi:hypothetical protein
MVRNSPDKFKEATELISAKTSPNVIRAINRFSQTVFDKALR